MLGRNQKKAKSSISKPCLVIQTHRSQKLDLCFSIKVLIDGFEIVVDS